MKRVIQLISKENIEASIDIKLMEGIIGQQAAIAKLKFFASTHDEKTPVPSFLFTGSHGLGKTYVAEKLASSMNRRFVEVNCGAIESDKDLIEGILINRVIGDTPVTIFFDESHRLNSEITTILLSLINPSQKMKNHIHYKNWNLEYDMSKINVIFATTDAHKMFGPLVNRCERIYFEAYNHKDLINMLRLYLPDVNFECDLDDLASACRGRGRDTFQLSQKIHRYLKQNNTKTLDIKGWDEIKNVFEIYPSGLNRQEVELLEVIQDAGSISLSNLALSMMLNVDNIESELEVRPRELGFIQNSSRGRSLTEKGENYVSKHIR